MLRSVCTLLRSLPASPVRRALPCAASSLASLGRAQPAALAPTAGPSGARAFWSHAWQQREREFFSQGRRSPGLSFTSRQMSKQAAAAARPSSPAAGDDPPPSSGSAAAPANTQSYRLPLFLGYTAAGAGLTYVAGPHLEGSTALALVSTMWLGWVLAISLTEAWVKFKAPMLDRHVAVDVGRHVFPALNSVECALAVTLAMMVTKWGTAGTAPATIPLVLGGMVAAQTLCLTPALSLRAQHLIATSSKPEQLSAAQQAALEGIKKVCADNPEPPRQIHMLYGVFELSKVALLAAYIWQLVAV